MARKTRTQSVAQIAANFPDNNSEQITPAITREYLLDNIDSTQYLDLTSTRAALQTIQAASGLVLDQWYKITNAATSKVLLIKASSSNTFYPNAINLTDGGIGRYDIASNVNQPEIRIDANNNTFLFEVDGGGTVTFGTGCTRNNFYYAGGITFGNNCSFNEFKINSVSHILGNNCYANIFERSTGLFTFLSNLTFCTIAPYCNGEFTDFTNSAQLYNRALPWRINKIISADLIEVWFDVNQTSEVRGTYVPSTDVFTAYPAGGGVPDASALVAGKAKLYNAVGGNNDGSIDQVTITNLDLSNLKKTGQNSITLQSVNVGNPFANGVNLIAALAAVDALDWGVRSETNRGCLLLMPGTYNISGSGGLIMLPFIDIVGISTDRSSTIIKTGSTFIFQATTNAGFHNLTLIADVANNSLMFQLDFNNAFPIFENVYFGSENIFFRSGLSGSDFLPGSFNNCEFKSGIKSLYANNDISATISNCIINGNIIAENGLFTGKLINCKINTVGINDHSIKNIGDGAVIERCTIKTTSGFDSLFSATPVTPQILYTAMSSINANIANPAGRFNIVDATLV